MARTFYSGLYSSGPVFHDELFRNKEVPKNVFAFYLGKMDEESSLQLGTYSNSYMRNAAELTWLDLPYNYFWYSTADAFRVGNSSGKYFTEQPVIFDTGTTLSYIPSLLYTPFMDELTKGRDVQQESGFYIAKCSDVNKFKSLHLYIDNLWFEFTPKYYMIELGESYNGYDCLLGFSQGSVFLLGDSFLANYYSIHDNENSRIGFAPSVTSDAVIDPDFPYPDEQLKILSKVTIMHYLWMFLIEGLVFGAIFYGWYYLFHSGAYDWEEILGKETAAARPQIKKKEEEEAMAYSSIDFELN